MKRRFSILTLVLVTALAGTSMAAVGDDFLARVDRDVTVGAMTFEEGLLAKFHYAFAPDRLSPKLGEIEIGPIKCFTHVIAVYEERRAELSAETVAAIEAYLSSPDKDPQSIYISPSGIFEFTYFTVGQHAVSSVDVDPPNGIPDYVERCAEYMDFSWATVIDEMRFTPPVLDGYYPVTFENMSPYGYTQYLGGGRSRIALHNTFIGFPANDDPDGDILGAAKVTCAHEFKHASQYGGGTHGMGGWVELDATSLEELVYPATNDFHNYIPFGSPIADPELSLDDGGSGSYDDAVWQIWMSDTFTYQILVDHMLFRYANPSFGVLRSYDLILQQYGMTLREAWEEFTAWNSATYTFWGIPNYGYSDAIDMPPPGTTDFATSYPYSVNATVARVAAHFVRCLGVGGVDKVFEVEFQGTAGIDFTVTAIVYDLDGNAVVEPIELDENNYALHQVDFNLLDAFKAAVVVGNAERTGISLGYSLTVRRADPTATPVEDGIPAVLALDGAYPNPFNPRTNIKFRLPTTGHTELQVMDLSGSLVTTIFSGELEAGEHSLTWDGRDARGRGVAAGTYFARLRSDGRAVTTKMVLAK